MKEIHLSRTLLVVVVIFVVAAGIATAGLFGPRFQLPSTPVPSPTADESAAAAATAAVEQVFRVDYHEGKAVWLARICAKSTPAGCALFSDGADRLWEKYEQAGTIVAARVKSTQQITAGVAEQVWRTEVTLSSPLPGSIKTEDSAYVVLVRTEEGWKFDRFLLQAEVDALLARQQTPASARLEESWN